MKLSKFVVRSHLHGLGVCGWLGVHGGVYCSCAARRFHTVPCTLDRVVAAQTMAQTAYCAPTVDSAAERNVQQC